VVFPIQERTHLSIPEISRANVQYSTEPKTEAGKHYAYLNAVCNGLTNQHDPAEAACEKTSKALAALSLYRQRLSRQFERTVTQLREIQKARLDREAPEISGLQNTERKGVL